MRRFNSDSRLELIREKGGSFPERWRLTGAVETVESGKARAASPKIDVAAGIYGPVWIECHLPEVSVRIGEVPGVAAPKRF